jgi:hypothetical protein
MATRLRHQATTAAAKAGGQKLASSFSPTSGRHPSSAAFPVVFFHLPTMGLTTVRLGLRCYSLAGSSWSYP